MQFIFCLRVKNICDLECPKGENIFFFLGKVECESEDRAVSCVWASKNTKASRPTQDQRRHVKQRKNKSWVANASFESFEIPVHDEKYFGVSVQNGGFAGRSNSRPSLLVNERSKKLLSLWWILDDIFTWVRCCLVEKHCCVVLGSRVNINDCVKPARGKIRLQENFQLARLLHINVRMVF